MLKVPDGKDAAACTVVRRSKAGESNGETTGSRARDRLHSALDIDQSVSEAYNEGEDRDLVLSQEEVDMLKVCSACCLEFHHPAVTHHPCAGPRLVRQNTRNIFRAGYPSFS
jgi:hypothetical protein